MVVVVDDVSGVILAGRRCYGSARTKIWREAIFESRQHHMAQMANHDD